MTPVFLLRLLLDFLALALLLVALAYDWLGNVAHEIIGTVMFALLLDHNFFNRWWYAGFSRRLSGQRVIRIGVNLSLLVSMLVLVTTSIIVSRTVFSFLPITSTVLARQLHTMVGYLVLLIAGVHLGMHWRMIMAVIRGLLGISGHSRNRTLILRGLTAMTALFGFVSLSVVNLKAKLTMEFTLEAWDFEAQAAAFFMHLTGIIGLGTAIGHYAIRMSQRFGK
ncbi:DUF4405 domain-containing protein [Microvirga sp. VF16]|uniref:DUF4405 domain-containing protein n=1 Tax=Microvirga sp. VF16 TaxID=2807101 RepID=UPI00193D79A1|nr:DUF4405 domain-containing protein [Microvirga sp. VF16]QRM33620.1 DUF4405 domain-containing protein [Microvirga sp. VF16]